VAYCWAEVPGFSHFGEYAANGSTDNANVIGDVSTELLIVRGATYTGAAHTYVWDNKREVGNAREKALLVNSGNAEGSGSYVDFTANGFKIRDVEDGMGRSGETYTFARFGRPFGGDGGSQARAQ